MKELTPSGVSARNVACEHARIKPHEIIADADAYIDTLGISLRYRPKGLLKALLRELGPKRAWYEPRFDAEGQRRSDMLIVQTPTTATISTLEAAQREHGGIISRVDVAFDFEARPGFDAAYVEMILENNTTLKWSPAGPMLDVETTVYFVKQKSRERKSGRDVAFYSDRPSKLTGELDAIHFEVRLQNARSVKANGIHTIEDLIKLNPKTLFDRNIAVLAFDEDREKLRFIKKNIAIERRTRRSAASAFLDQYRATLPRRLDSMWRRDIGDRVQAYARVHSTRHLERLRILSLPVKLAWSDIENAMKFRRNVVPVTLS